MSIEERERAHWRSVVSQFVSERCYVSHGNFATSRDLRAAYEDWSRQHGQAFLMDHRFGRVLSDLGFPGRMSSAYGHVGLRLKEE